MTDDRKDGILSLGILTQALENPFRREKNKMPEGITGCLVTRVIPGSSFDGYLKTGDILLTMNGLDIADDQTVEFRDQERTSYLYVIERFQIGEAVEIGILRDNGISQEVNFPLKTPIGNDSLVMINHGRSP